MDHKIDLKCPKLLEIPLLNTKHITIYIPRKTITEKLKPIEDIEVSNISWTKDDTDTTNCPVELPCIPSESSFQPKHYNTKH